MSACPDSLPFALDGSLLGKLGEMTIAEIRPWWKAICEAHGEDAVWIYVLLDGESNAVKIGRTTDLRGRPRDLQTGNPRELELVSAWRGNASQEREMHAEFQHLRIRGEWFACTDDLLRYVRNLNIYEPPS
ncbi:MAG TPA: GIY-YIG nuclease family protein [Solirubrobacteraceae bacterium]|jgi:hypothetical protein